MDELFEKTQALLKSLLSMKTMKPKDAVPALKAPSLKAPSIKPPSVGKIPGLPPPSKKDPVKVAQQLKNPNPGKVNVEVLKVEKNGQWSLEKAAPLHEISFTHQHHDLGGDGDLTHIKAIHPVHGVVGEAVFEHQPDKSIRLENIDVHPDHQRKGIGSSIVNHAQSLTGKPMLTSTGRTAAGEALWNKVKPPSTPSMLKMDPPEPKFKAGDHVDLGNDPGHTLEVVHSKWNPQSESYQYRLKVHSHPVGKTYGCGHEGESCGAQTNKPESVLVHKNSNLSKVNVEVEKTEDDEGFDAGLPGHIHLVRADKLHNGNTSYTYSHHISAPKNGVRGAVLTKPDTLMGQTHSDWHANPRTGQPIKGFIAVDPNNIITDISHDFGHAPPYVQAMMQAHKAKFPDHKLPPGVSDSKPYYGSQSDEDPTAVDMLNSFEPKKNRN